MSDTKKPTTRMTDITGLIFPSHRVKTMIKESRNGKGGNCNMGTNAANTSTIFVEQVTQEILREARTNARENKKKRVMIEHVNNGISNNQLLKRMFSGFDSAGYNGVLNKDYIIQHMREDARLSKKKKRKRKALKKKETTAVAKTKKRGASAVSKKAVKQPAKKRKTTLTAAQKKKAAAEKKKQEEEEEDDDEDDEEEEEDDDDEEDDDETEESDTDGEDDD